MIPRGEEESGHFPAKRLCDVVGVSTRGLRTFRNRPASRRQRSDLVTLAHIKEQSRLSLESYGRPRMTEELKEIGLNVGHRSVGRLMRQNGISVVRTRKHKLLGHPKDALPANGSQPIATISSALRRTCWTGTSPLISPIRNGRVTLAMFGRVKAGYTWL